MVNITTVRNKFAHFVVASMPCEGGTLSLRKDYKTGTLSYIVNDGWSVRYCDHRDYKTLKQTLADAIAKHDQA